MKIDPYLKINCDKKGGFGREVKFEISIGLCHVCGERGMILCSGVGVDEYGTADICLDCIQLAFNKFQDGKYTKTNLETK